MDRITIRAAAFVAAAMLACATHADELSKRTELKRVDLSGAPGMEVVSSIVEVRPGGEVARHLHHGVEAGYVLEGAMVQLPGKEPTEMAAGAPILNLRDAPHGGFKGRRRPDAQALHGPRGRQGQAAV